jgi:hypothetical protein
MLDRKRRLIKIDDIDSAILEEALKQIKNYSISQWQWHPQYPSMMRKIYGGYCIVCMCKPDKVATFRIGKGTLTERYCNEHLFHVYDNLKGIDEKIIIKYR